MRLRSIVVVALCVFALLPGAAVAGDPAAPAAQQRLIAKGQERTTDFDTAPFRRLLVAAAARRTGEQAAIPLADPERLPLTDPCTVGTACVGDVRLDRWAEDGHGIVKPFLFTARDGATLSGRMWATRSGPAKRPVVLIVNGSIVGFEELYWWAAQALAKAGYVVMTFDAQGEGRSDQLGEAPDVGEAPIAGTPPIGSGEPFYDGGQDALDFLLSTPSSPYVPRVSRSSGTSHAAKQARRVAGGLNAAYNPLWAMVDPSRVGITGHSYGAIAASYLAQSDPRVDAGVAWDSLCVPRQPAPAELSEFTEPGAVRGTPAAFYAFARDCFGAPPGPQPAIAKPVLGITGDYLLLPAPYPSAPDPSFKSRASRAISAAGVDSGQIVIRGGTHYEYMYYPSSLFPATLRGIDLTAWYTVAWFDKYLRGDVTADSRLLTGRWRADAANGAADAGGDANLFSELYRSRMDIGRAGGRGRAVCEDLRAGCPSLVAASDDCGPKTFRYLDAALTPDVEGDPLVAPCSASVRTAGSSGGRVRCVSARRFTIRLGPVGTRLSGLRVTVAGRRARVRPRRGAGRPTAVVDLRGRGRAVVRVVITGLAADRAAYREVRRYRLCGG